MSKRSYTHVEEHLPENKAMVTAGKTQWEIAEHFGFKDKYVIKRVLKRERTKQCKLKAGITPRPKGRPRKESAPRDIIAEQACKIGC